MRKGEKLICNFNDRLFSPPLDEAKEDLMKRCYVRRREGKTRPPRNAPPRCRNCLSYNNADLEFACLLKSAFRAAIEERLRDSFHSVH